MEKLNFEYSTMMSYLSMNVSLVHWLVLSGSWCGAGIAISFEITL